MRFSDRITFIYQKESNYDPEIGEYVETEPIPTVKACNLSPIGVNRQATLFGSINTNITIARLQNPYNDEFDHVEVNGKNYKVMKQSNYKKGVLFLEGDFNG